MTAGPFSPAGRRAALEAMATGPVDLLVIGGGITGAGLAREAALCGLRVALVEKADFGYGTSGRSSKLIHGGLRYLAYGELGLVRESARERQVLRGIAPHLVHPLPFLFPLYQGESLTRFRAGFWLFDRLAGATRAEAHRFLSGAEVRRRVPGLRGPLAAGVVYGEYCTEDSRLTLENALSAARHGALVANHAPVLAFRFAGRRVTGARVQDALTGREYEVAARVVVNATGPWAQETLRAGALAPPRRLLLSKGIHLLFPAGRIPLEGAVVLKSPSGREGFAIRRWNYVYIGTTDAPHPGRIDRPVADQAAVADLLQLARDCFPDAGLTEADIISTWAGLRPLIAEAGKSTRETSRHDQVWRIREGLLTVAGGKLTTYRPMAARVLAQVARELGRSLERGQCGAEVPLPYGNLGGQEVAAFRQEMAAALRGRGVPAPAVERITWLYGTGVRELLRLGDTDPAWLQPLAPGCPALRAEVKLAVEQEMALTLADFMDRRAALLIFSDDQGLAAAGEAAEIMANLLGWSPAERERQLAAYRELAAAHRLPAG